MKYYKSQDCSGSLVYLEIIVGWLSGTVNVLLCVYSLTFGDKAAPMLFDLTVTDEECRNESSL